MRFYRNDDVRKVKIIMYFYLGVTLLLLFAVVIGYMKMNRNTMAIESFTFAALDFCGLESVVCDGEIDVTGKDYIQELIISEAKHAGIDPDIALRIAQCESNFDAYARNPKSSASGVYQFTKGTWDWIGALGDAFDPHENIRQFVKWFPRYPEWWSECL